MDIYQPAFDYAKTIRLFLTEESRDEFSRLVREIGILHTPLKALSYERRIIKREKEVKPEIQRILEEHLSNPNRFENYNVPTMPGFIRKCHDLKDRLIRRKAL